MRQAKYINKDKFVSIYEIAQKRIANEERLVTIKRFAHPQDTTLRAYIRQLSATERITEAAATAQNDYEIVINYRDGIRVGQYVAYRNMTLVINGVDAYDLNGIELKLRCATAQPVENVDLVEFA